MTHIVYLGLNDFPFGLAETQKVKLVARGLVHSGCRVTVLSRYWGADNLYHDTTLPPRGTIEGIEYVAACGTLYRPASWFARKVVRLKGLFLEPFILYGLRRTGGVSAAIISTGSFLNVVYYRLWSRLFGFPVIVHIVELYTAALRSRSTYRRLNARLFDTRVARLVDGALPISEYLIRKVEQYAPGTPMLKDPCLVDLARFDHLAPKPAQKYILFCGYLGYMEVIRFILRSFELLEIDQDLFLYLVVNGSPGEFEQLTKEISAMKKASRVRTFSKVSDEDLARLYVDAYALLIPLRPTLQDIARFPHKIGEYCAAGRPVVTTAYGEVNARFRNGENAVVASAYDEGEYAKTLDGLLKDPATADRIGRNGRHFAETEFAYQVFGPKLKAFIQNGLVNKKQSAQRDAEKDQRESHY